MRFFKGGGGRGVINREGEGEKEFWFCDYVYGCITKTKQKHLLNLCISEVMRVAAVHTGNDE